MFCIIYFRHGKIQSVKFIPQPSNDRGCAVVAFMDIKSAAKAHNTENNIDGSIIQTQYSEPTASGGTVTVARPAEPAESSSGKANSASTSGTTGDQRKSRFPNREG